MRHIEMGRNRFRHINRPEGTGRDILRHGETLNETHTETGLEVRRDILRHIEMGRDRLRHIRRQEETD